jgi:hypothetical protein
VGGGYGDGDGVGEGEDIRVYNEDVYLLVHRSA